MHFVEELMYQVSGFFLAPVLLVIVLLFLYACFASGDFVVQAMQRRRYRRSYRQGVEQWWQQDGTTMQAAMIKGYDLFNYASHQPLITEDNLSVFARKRLENLRVVTRIAPMLGLVATMIPMGPALKSLANGNIQGISENLIVAFSAVIFGLVISSATFWIAAVKKRWLADEMVDLLAKSTTESKV